MSYRDEPEDQAAEAIETQRAHCPKCGRYFLRELSDAWGTVNRETKCDPCARWWSMDSRDKRPDPPAVLDVNRVRRMQAMVKDAAANGDRPWPYLGAA